MHELSLHQEFAMPVNRLFQCFCKTELLVQWFSGDAMRLQKIVMNLEKGAEFEMEFVSEQDEGGEHYSGQIVEIFPNEEILFTLKADEQTETSVDVRFTGLRDRHSELHLTHSGLADTAMWQHTQQLWEARFNRLARLGDLPR